MKIFIEIKSFPLFSQIFLLFLFIFESSSENESVPEAEKAIFKILKGTYNKEIRPPPLLDNNTNTVKNEKNKPTKVKVNLTIREIDKISDISMEITLQLTLRQNWIDRRLAYNMNDPDLDYVTLNEETADKIWTPDLFFATEKESYIHQLMRPNSYKRLYPSGKITWSARVTSTFSCPMDFKFFPFDEQRCNIPIFDFSHTTSDIIITWDNISAPVGFASEYSRHSKFTLKGHRIGDYSSLTNQGNYGGIFFDLYFERQSAVYVSSVFIPSSMCLLLSWISFWLGPRYISLRLTLALTLLLTMTTQLQSTSQTLPLVSYTKALDVWTGFCLAAGALCIVQNAVVAAMTQKNKSILAGFGNKVLNLDVEKQRFHEMVENPLIYKIDKASRILFPSMFLLFTLVYILIYVVRGNSLSKENLV